MQIFYTREAEKNLLKLNKPDAKKCFIKCEALKNNPLAGKPLKGQLSGLYSLRAWPYRIIYKIEKDSNKLIILSIKHRQSVY